MPHVSGESGMDMALRGDRVVRVRFSTPQEAEEVRRRLEREWSRAFKPGRKARQFATVSLPATAKKVGADPLETSDEKIWRMFRFTPEEVAEARRVWTEQRTCERNRREEELRRRREEIEREVRCNDAGYREAMELFRIEAVDPILQRIREERGLGWWELPQEELDRLVGTWGRARGPERTATQGQMDRERLYLDRVERENRERRRWREERERTEGDGGEEEEKIILEGDPLAQPPEGLVEASRTGRTAVKRIANMLFPRKPKGKKHPSLQLKPCRPEGPLDRPKAWKRIANMLFSKGRCPRDVSGFSPDASGTMPDRSPRALRPIGRAFCPACGAPLWQAFDGSQACSDRRCEYAHGLPAAARYDWPMDRWAWDEPDRPLPPIGHDHDRFRGEPHAGVWVDEVPGAWPEGLADSLALSRGWKVWCTSSFLSKKRDKPSIVMAAIAALALAGAVVIAVLG